MEGRVKLVYVRACSDCGTREVLPDGPSLATCVRIAGKPCRNCRSENTLTFLDTVCTEKGSEACIA